MHDIIRHALIVKYLPDTGSVFQLACEPVNRVANNGECTSSDLDVRNPHDPGGEPALVPGYCRGIVLEQYIAVITLPAKQRHFQGDADA